VTFCLGMKVRDGLIGIADTRVISGNENISARKISVHEIKGHQVFLMTSGLRSVRDKSMAYFEEALETEDEPLDRLFKVANAFAKQIRRVSDEDRETLAASGLHFNIFCLLGGRMQNDDEHKLFLIYPQANWVEIGESTPYSIIGQHGYGKPVLDRTLKFGDSLRFAMQVGCLAFDSTRISAPDVDFPIDVAIYRADTGELYQRRFGKDDLSEMSDGWQDRLRSAVLDLPEAWQDEFFEEIYGGPDNVRSLS
jgi:putative proteasome-type protease